MYSSILVCTAYMKSKENQRNWTKSHTTYSAMKTVSSVSNLINNIVSSFFPVYD